MTLKVHRNPAKTAGTVGFFLPEKNIQNILKKSIDFLKICVIMTS